MKGLMDDRALVYILALYEPLGFHVNGDSISLLHDFLMKLFTERTKL